MSNAPQNATISRPVLGGLVLLILIIGSSYAGYVAVQKHNQRSSEESIRIGAGTPQDQQTAERLFQSFVSDVRDGSFDQALQFAAPTYPQPHTAGGLKNVTQADLAPLLSSDAFRFEPVHMASHGQKMFLRAAFHSAGKPYGIVCTIVKMGSGWRIGDLRKPVTREKPPVSSFGGASSM